VHFLRFELDAASLAAVRAGATIRMGIDHPAMPCAVELNAASRASLAADID
jgi:hypothetical protein